MSDNFLSTKFIMTILVLILSYILVLIGKLDAKQWMDIAVIAGGIYAGANVAQKFAPDQK